MESIKYKTAFFEFLMLYNPVNPYILSKPQLENIPWWGKKGGQTSVWGAKIY